MKKNFLTIITCLLIVPANAQLGDLLIYKDSLFSNILAETRRLRIVLPAGYDTSKQSYNVILVTDGEWNTRIVSNTQQYLAGTFVPEAIVVGICDSVTSKGNQRNRDFTPTQDTSVAGSGGAAKFVEFIKTELFPYLHQRLRTTGNHLYIGSSLGGLFGMYALLQSPRLFNGFLLADPSLWWGHGWLTGFTKQQLAAQSRDSVNLFIAAREGRPYEFMGTAGMDSLLRAEKPAGLRYTIKIYSEETHNSILLPTVYDGLKFMYPSIWKEAINSRK